MGVSVWNSCFLPAESDFRKLVEIRTCLSQLTADTEIPAALRSAVAVAPVWCWEVRWDWTESRAKSIRIYRSHFIFCDTWKMCFRDTWSTGVCGLDIEKNRNNHKDLILYWSKSVIKSLLCQSPSHQRAELIALEEREQKKTSRSDQAERWDE